MGFVRKTLGSLGDSVMFGRRDSKEQAVTDAFGSDSQALIAESGMAGKILVTSLDRVVHLQRSAITGYVDWLRSKNPEASPAEIQDLMNKHFVRLATGTGAGAGTAAAIPGIGFVTGALTISAESLVFLDAAAFYTVASAYLRGADITDSERRKALILVALSGSQGTALVDASLTATSSVSAISSMSPGNVREVNNQLVKIALNQISKRMKQAWIGKIMPMGIGAVLGTMANRKLAAKVVHSTSESLGALPSDFDTPAPSEDEVQEPVALLASQVKE
ncbi:hypothetical protein CIP107580_00912 [Corynebacterium diphtheriae]|uniref:hypothetical protein n=1 Tax=Corynebacterium diphtheriae TaxID=1717 RepID=UPI0002DD393A|nr:hypothetical protein [Corynebacterium diphtheriae]MBG9289181.1 hypothetical protein [Corynebacterium diphtheriae bv. gravis]OJI03466.1 hypothetical protein BKD75_01865 [Corynebacterium diphtheriae]CAB0546272.1 hypothetical protein CIP107514_00891 [Corynebacterium diphtheriae]CAB0557151.1 hypothetical protein CIP107533_00937 [Corynebacterium diphtheriae]CAB0558226.1 hypothetical protein CIP107532_00966 [Corynebacterium diphtheriae]